MILSFESPRALTQKSEAGFGRIFNPFTEYWHQMDILILEILFGNFVKNFL